MVYDFREAESDRARAAKSHVPMYHAEVTFPLIWSELTQEQKCILVNAVKSSSLQEVLSSWELDSAAPDLLGQVPRLANAIGELARAGLVEVYQSPSATIESHAVLEDEIESIVQDPANWWTDEGPASWVELTATSWADAIFATRGDEDLYDFRRHDPR